MEINTIVLITYIILNIVVFLIYGIDKLKAKKNQWRIPEKTLILSAVLGIFGAILGMLIFHHKTRKPKFYIGVPVILILEIIAVLLLFKLPIIKEKSTMNSYEQISQEEAKKIMDEETDYILLDVRTIEEYNSGHIKGAICIPNETIADTEPDELPDKDKLILVYCRSGNRSRQAAAKLADIGYTNIKEFGGINTWPYGTE